MNSKKWNKIGVPILSALAPACALGVTVGVLAASKPAVGEFKITEPTQVADRHADSAVTSDKWTPAANEKIKYLFTFPGVFSVEGGKAEDFKSASATLEYQPPVGGSPITYDMSGTIDKVSDTTFKVTLWKEFTYGVDTSIFDIVGNTDLTVKNLKIKYGNTEYVCKETYTSTIVPNLVFDNTSSVMEVAITGGPTSVTTSIPFVNKISNALPDVPYGTSIGSPHGEFPYKEGTSSGWAQNYIGWCKDNNDDKKVYFYCNFNTVPSTAGQEVEVGYEFKFQMLGGSDVTYFKKPVDTKPIIKFKTVSD